MKVNLEDDNVCLIETTTAVVRQDVNDDVFRDELETALYNLQGLVFTDEASVAYVVIKITKG